MKFLGPTTVHGFYPVDSQEEAFLSVQKGVFLYTNGIVGSAIYLYHSEERAFELKHWVVECTADLKNVAEVSVESGEFDDIFRYKMVGLDLSMYNYHEQQRHIVLHMGYDGLVFDCGFTAVYGGITGLRAIKAYPKIKDVVEKPEYNNLWRKIKGIGNIFKKENK